MARTLRSLESQEVINASLNHKTPNTSSLPASPEPETSRHPQATVLVQDSLEDKTQAVRDSAAQSLAPTIDLVEDEDLYGVSPQRTQRNDAVRSSQKQQAVTQSPPIELGHQTSNSELAPRQAAVIAKAALAGELQPKSSSHQDAPSCNTPPAKLKLLTQRSSEQDTVQPAFTKGDLVEGSASSKSRSPSQGGSSHKKSSHIASATSQTSAMVSARKNGTASAAEGAPKSFNKSSSTLERLKAKKALGSGPQSSISATINQAAQGSANARISKFASQAEPVSKKVASGAGASKSKTQGDIASNKNIPTKSTKNQIANVDSQAKQPSMEPADAEGSRASSQKSPHPTHPAEAHHVEEESAPTTLGAGAQNSLRTGKLKKPSLARKGKAKKIEEEAEDMEPPPDEAEDEDDDDPVRLSQPRKRGKAGLKSQPKRSTRTRQTHVDDDFEDLQAQYDLDSAYSPPRGRARRNAREPKGSKKPVPKTKPEEQPTKATARSTRAQKAAVLSSKSNAQSNQAADALQAGTSKVATPHMDTAASKAGGKMRRVEAPSTKHMQWTIEEPGAEDDGLAQPSRVDRGKAKVRGSPLKPTRPQRPQRSAPAESPRQALPSGTQENAIPISDNDQSSSSPPPADPSPNDREQVSIAAQHDGESRDVAHRPRTPAHFRSSPPPFAEHGDEDDVALSAAARSHKTTIVGFDKDGPRNQGTLSGKTPGSKSARAYRDSLAATKVALASSGAKAKLEAHRQKRASSVAASTRTTKSNRPAPESNIAVDFDDALASLGRKVKIPAHGAGSHPKETASLFPPPPSAGPAIDVEGYDNIDDLEGDTFVEEQVSAKPPSPKMPPMGRTASQIKMPPPANKRVVDNAAVLPTVEYERESPEISNQMSKASRVKRSRPAEPVLEEPSCKRPKAQHVTEREAGFESETSIAIDQHQKPVVESHSKHSKAKDVAREEYTAPNVNITAAEDIVIKNVKQTERKRARDEEFPAQDSTKRVKHGPGSPKVKAAGRTSGGNQKIAQASMRETRTGRRPIQPRQTSQGSQTVDITGSPVPPDMEVTGDSTVLETFSQQKVFSPDVSSKIATAMGRKQESALDSEALQESDETDPFRAPPSHQRGPLSSNMKPRPAAPNAESKIIPRVDIRDLQAKEHSPLANIEDPFRSSQEDQLTDADDIFTRKTTFTKKFDFFGKQRGHYDPIKRDFSRLPSPKQPTVPVNAFVKNNQRQFDKLSSITRHRPYAREKEDERESDHIDDEEEDEEDPDKTLVNDDDEYEDGGFEGSQDSDGGDANGDAAIDPEDILSWRKTAKPHQLNLFDGLVKCSHRIAAFFAEQENNIERVLERQHKQGLYVIEQEELLRAKEYEQLKEALGRAKLERKNDFQHQKKEMEKLLTDRRRLKSKRIVAAGQREDEIKQLEALVAVVMA